MKLSTLQKFGGVSLILGSALLAAYSILFAALLPVTQLRSNPLLGAANHNWTWIAAVVFVGIILMIFGFMAVYSKIYDGSGAAGFLGFIVIEIAYVLQACKVTWEIFIYPLIAGNPAFAPLLSGHILQNNAHVHMFNMAMMVTILLGIVLFCFALVRSNKFPKVAGILIFAGALIYGLGPMLTTLVAISGIVILAIGCLILGLKLIRAELEAA
jgi:hypothetical protein